MENTRRNFIKQMGYVSIGFSLIGTGCMTEIQARPALEDFPGSVSDPSRINAWLQILGDGQIKVFTGKHELGQGLRIAIQQVAAEELNCEPGLINVSLAETGVTPDEGYTAGSNSIERSAMAVRYAAASAREKLIQLASKNFDVDEDSLSLENGIITTTDKKITLYDLLKGQQIEEKVGEPKELKGKTVRKWVGKPVPRKDIVDMVQGNPVYVQDLRFSGMVHARVVRPETYTSKLISINESEFDTMPGFLKMTRIGSFLGVIAEEEYQAIKIRDKAVLSAEWEAGEKLPAKIPLKAYLKTIPADTTTEEELGEYKGAGENSVMHHKANYYKPYIMHAANGPSCAVAYFKNGKLDVWSHTQGVYPLRKSLSSLLEIAEDDIHVKGVPGSGCYGHNGADDVAAEAALIAVSYPEKHVRLQWMREDEHGWEPYGSAMLMKLQAGLDNDGKITSWKYDFWSDGHSTRPGGAPESLLPARFLDKGHRVPGIGYKGGAVRNSKPYYKIPNLQTVSHIFQGPLRKSALRGLGAYANVFAIESFMDELAYKSKQDPIDFRLKHLDDSRAKECLTKIRLNTSAVKIGDDEGIGYSFARYKNEASYCAIAAKVYIDRSLGAVQVKHMWAVIDAGECINPDGLKNQTEGGMIQSASWALMEEVHFDENHITCLDWDSYPIFRFPDTPQIDVDVIDRPSEPAMGAGEAAQGPATAAIVNAIFNATGVRVRELPVKKALLVNVN